MNRELPILFNTDMVQAIPEGKKKVTKRQAIDRSDVWGDGQDDKGNIIYDMYDCPGCGKSYEIDYHDYKYCPECGQAIDEE